MDDVSEHLRDGYLDRLPGEDLAALKRLGRTRRWLRGAALLAEGNKSDWVE